MPLEAFGFFLLLAAVGATVLAFLAVRGARTPESFSVALVMLGAALVAYGHGIELLNERIEELALGRAIYSFGWGLAAPAFLDMALRFGGDPGERTIERLIKLYAPPVVLTAGAATNGFHHLFYRVIGVDQTEGHARLVVEPTMLHWLNSLILLVYGASAIAILLRSRRTLARSHRRAALVLALCGLPVVVTAILHHIGWRILGVVSPLPFVMVFAAFFHFALTMRRDFLDLRPLARDVLMERLPDGIIVIDGQGSIIDHNAEAIRLLSLPTPIIGRSANDVLSVLPRAAARIASDARAEFEINDRVIEVRTARIARGKGSHSGLILQIHDGTEARRMERALALALRRESQLGALGRALSVTHRLEELPGVTLPLVGEILGAERCALMLQADGSAIAGSWTPEHGVIDDGGPGTAYTPSDPRQMMVILDPRGITIGALTAFRPRPFDEVDAAVGETVRWLLTNALANTLLMIDMERAARTDALTGLDNRASFVEAGEREIQLAIRHGRPLSLAICDLDHFKSINDRFGHSVGDAALVEAARRIANATRSTDLVARWGGEEFAVLMPEADLSAAGIVAERIRHSLCDEPFVLDEGALSLTVSVGVAALNRDAGEWLSALTERADRALYAAKNSGRNRAVVDTSVAA